MYLGIPEIIHTKQRYKHNEAALFSLVLQNYQA